MGSKYPMRRGNCEGERTAHSNVQKLAEVSCAKTAEPIKMPFGMWTPAGARKQALDGGCTLAPLGVYD